jgi:hypothetical protein
MTEGRAWKSKLVVLRGRQPGKLVVFPSVHCCGFVVVHPVRLDAIFAEVFLRLSNEFQHVEVLDRVKCPAPCCFGSQHLRNGFGSRQN